MVKSKLTRVDTVFLAAIETTNLASLAINIFLAHIPTAIAQTFFTQPWFWALSWLCFCLLVSFCCIHTHSLAATEAAFLIFVWTVKVHSTLITHFVTETSQSLPGFGTGSLLPSPYLIPYRKTVTEKWYINLDLRSLLITKNSKLGPNHSSLSQVS